MKVKIDLFKENDLELLDRIKQNDEQALEIMIEKYKPLICSKIRDYRFPSSEQDDFLQEGIMVLTKAINSYRDDKDKTFTRYFELLLTNRFNSLYKKNKNYYANVILDEEKVNNTNDILVEVPNIIDDLNIKLSKLEKKVYELYFLNHLKIKDIEEALNLSSKQVYNSIRRIREKINSDVNTDK